MKFVIVNETETKVFIGEAINAKRKVREKTNHTLIFQNSYTFLYSEYFPVYH